MDHNTGGGRGWGRRGREANSREKISANSRHQKKTLINIFRVHTNKNIHVLTAEILKRKYVCKCGGKVLEGHTLLRMSPCWEDTGSEQGVGLSGFSFICRTLIYKNIFMCFCNV